MTNFGIIQNCIITHSKSEIVFPYIDSVDDLKYKVTKSLYDGIDLTAQEVYTPCNCVVIDISKQDNLYTVTVQYSKIVSLRFCHLKSVNVEIGAPILKDTLIGYAEKYVHFEYLTTDRNSLNWCFRVRGLELYKHNPNDVLNGNIVFRDDVILEPLEEEERHKPDGTLYEDQLYEQPENYDYTGKS